MDPPDLHLMYSTFSSLFPPPSVPAPSVLDHWPQLSNLIYSTFALTRPTPLNSATSSLSFFPSLPSVLAPTTITTTSNYSNIATIIPTENEPTANIYDAMSDISYNINPHNDTYNTTEQPDKLHYDILDCTASDTYYQEFPMDFLPSSTYRKFEFFEKNDTNEPP